MNPIPYSKNISKRDKAILVFPNIIKAELVFGGSYREGVLLKNAQVIDYCNFVSGSWGFQAGAQTYGYTVFLMSDKAIQYLENTKIGKSVLALLLLS